MSKVPARRMAGVVLGLLCVAVLRANAQAAAPSGAPARPNVIIILADDLGFSDIGAYGGEIETPNLDRLAESGLRFTQMYNTGRCWPTRGALLTGYYAQQVNRDPPHQRPAWAALLPEMLRPAGYRSYHAGKWHVDSTPVAAGFDRSYWFQDYNRYFTPKEHYLDDRPLPAVGPDAGFYATTAIAEHAADFLAEHAREHEGKPFLLYLAFIAPHFPLHALQADIDKYRDRYLAGWDVIRERRWRRLCELGIVSGELSARDPAFTPRYLKPGLLEKLGEGEVVHAVAWDELTPEQRRFQATKMAIHAAMVDRMDREIGRVLAQIRAMGQTDNTLVFFLSDNGADASVMVRADGHDQSAAPGSAATFLCLGPGWATAANAPFRRHKVWMHEGGIATPMIVSWPSGIDRSQAGTLCRTPAHVIDLAPTILELAGVPWPERHAGWRRPPTPGRSLVPALRADVTIAREHLYWHHEENRALRVGDWKIVSERESGGVWELYNLAGDRIESKNLAAVEPERLRELTGLWERLDAQYHQDGATSRPAG